MSTGLDALNGMSADEAIDTLMRCCGSTTWATAMAGLRPFASLDALTDAAQTEAAQLTEDDWREAFDHHPRIGDVDSLREKFAPTAQWASQEQGAVAAAPDSVIEALAQANRAYEERFGHIFLICATGKRAEEMLLIMDQRMDNDPAREWQVAIGEQQKITALRLEKLVNEGVPA